MQGLWQIGKRWSMREQGFVASVLRRHNGNTAAAARELGAPHETWKQHRAVLKRLRDTAIKFYLPTSQVGMKNPYRICGDVTYITLRRRNGETMETKIDTEDLDRLINFSATWCPALKKNGWYAVAKVPGSKANIPLHRFILKTPAGLVADHIHHDTLDNRKSELRSVTHMVNQQNRRGAARTNPSGVRGVQWHKANEKWRARITVNKEVHFLGYFDTVPEAAEVVTNFLREKGITICT